MQYGIGQQTEKPLEDTYLSEFMRNLHRLKRSLDRLKNGEDAPTNLQTMLTAAKTISDLAMIHGYDGVENVANKMVLILQKLLKCQTGIHESLHHMFESAINTIRNIAEIENGIEESLTVEHINRKAMVSEAQVQSTARQQHEHLDSLYRSQIDLHQQQNSENTDNSDGRIEFDIRESDLLDNIAGA